MDNLLGPGTTLGYCTNVHAGANWEQTRANLEKYALGVKARVSPNSPMGVGLWLSARSAREVLEQVGIETLRDWLGENGLNAFTFNGFPHGDFHQPRVKHLVYRPDWTESDRLDYTLDLIEILSGLLEEGGEGSLSTLPLGWGKGGSVDLAAAARQILTVAERLRRLEGETGKVLHLNLEPEPGCALDRWEDVTDFFKDCLLKNTDEEAVLRYIRVCHDVCHSAVMVEDQAEAFDAYRSLGVRIGKVQISSAVRLDLEALNPTDQIAALDRLEAFHEERYLHQTVVRAPSGETEFFEDLPEALASLRKTPRGEVRVHFHVPLFLESVGPIGTTQSLVREGMNHLLDHRLSNHYEVETYAWGVLPKPLRSEDLAEGIAKEILWVRENLAP